MEETLIKAIVDGNPEEGYSAHLELMPGVISEGDTLEDLRENLLDALSLAIESYKEEKWPYPAGFDGAVKIEFDLTPETFFQMIEVLKSSAVAKRSGINTQLLSHYLNGHRNPSKKQLEKIESVIHQIGRELMSVRLVKA